MRLHWPLFSASQAGNKIRWVGPIQPTPLSTTYKVSVDYELGIGPDVRVIAPTLTVRPGAEKLPHVYSGNRLCLYVPGSGQWNPSRPISETTIPWTSLWLYFYEVWHASGEWLGGGEHSASGPKTPEGEK
jgi:hypothetical protein